MTSLELFEKLVKGEKLTEAEIELISDDLKAVRVIAPLLKENIEIAHDYTESGDDEVFTTFEFKIHEWQGGFYWVERLAYKEQR